MAAKSVRIGCVGVWLVTVGASGGSVVVLVTNHFTSLDGTKTSFKSFIAFRYLLSTAAIGCLYALIQLPFATYYAYNPKKLIPTFHFLGDQIVVLLMASGVGAGFAVSLELRKIVKQLAEFFADVPGIDVEKSNNLKFLDKVNISTALLLVACFCLALLSIFSSINRSTTTRGFFFK
ncbi:CASP-like protein 4D1 [Euphorbia lathyris]|uniref:CASP-like protein 4D1 n=1 Tax=Euphorbia lathyris TaxID=212925 RepID=UPI003313E437